MKIKQSWLLRLRTMSVAGISLCFLLNIDQFGEASGLGPAPKYWSIGFFLAAVVLFLPGFKLSTLLRKPIAWWGGGYLLMSIFWMGWADHQESAQDGMVLVVTTVLYVGTAILAYPNIDHSSRLWHVTLWLALSVAVATIVLEYFVPSAYVFAEAGQGIEGRAAGLYLNPNFAGQTLVMILASLLLRGSRTTNLIAALVVLPGLFLTFSRGGLLAWAILVVAAAVRGRLPRWFLLVLVVCTALVVFTGPQVLDALSVWISAENRNSLDRLAWLLGQGDLNDFSAGEREYIAGFGWSQYLQAPVIGHGLGYMWVWAASVGTHNLILRHLVEYGILGALIFPLFLYCGIKASPPGTDRPWLWLVAAIALLLSLFSHNMLEQASFVLSWLAICLMPPGVRSPPARHGKQEGQHAAM